ncbi:MAG: bifunctional oligoribonuclease/PAP phosphatase NrnA [Lachnospiraceae bacterium]|nr:bifunctional oligoribonuclease/PAP phosphatase NrnA [Lachnospiraceae bacterium]
MKKIVDIIKGASTIAIGGHIRPDGDCIGSCMGLYNYLRENFSDVEVDVYLQKIPDRFKFIKNSDAIISDVEEDKKYDLFIVLDSSDIDRLGEFQKYFDEADRTFCIDHHISNNHYADEDIVVDNASSTSEVIYELMDEEKVSKAVAECIYIGIVHDSGVFKYQSTTKRTMEIAGELMQKGIPFTKIIDDTFYTKSYIENQILGRALVESVMFFNGKCIVSAISKGVQDFYGITSDDMGGIVEQLRITKDVECAIFMYETEHLKYKVSMRSKEIVDVSKIATYFGGGGHMRAAGFNMEGNFHDVVNNISEQIALQLD